MRGSKKKSQISFRRMNKQTLVYPPEHGGGGTRGKNTFYIIKTKVNLHSDRDWETN